MKLELALDGGQASVSVGSRWRLDVRQQPTKLTCSVSHPRTQVNRSRQGTRVWQSSVVQWSRDDSAGKCGERLCITSVNSICNTFFCGAQEIEMSFLQPFKQTQRAHDGFILFDHLKKKLLTVYSHCIGGVHDYQILLTFHDFDIILFGSMMSTLLAAD